MMHSHATSRASLGASPQTRQCKKPNDTTVVLNYRRMKTRVRRDVCAGSGQGGCQL